jgi:hypothetical protein
MLYHFANMKHGKHIHFILRKTHAHNTQHDDGAADELWSFPFSYTSVVLAATLFFLPLRLSVMVTDTESGRRTMGVK